MKPQIHTMHCGKIAQKGTSLVEVMVTLAVIGFGILGILYMQGELTYQSDTSKARVEAIAIAEDRIEFLRNYTYSEITSPDDPDKRLLASSREDLEDLLSEIISDPPEALPSTFSGVNAEYEITMVADSTEVAVSVSWGDRRGEENEKNQKITLTSDIAWISPVTVGSGGIPPEVASSDYVPPTGIALIGEGKITPLLNPESPDDPVASLLATSTDDEIKFYEHDGDLLIVDGDDIVMTFPDLCKDSSTCQKDVVTINGRLYLDNEINPQNGKAETPFELADLKIKSSDTTYCTQFNEGSIGDYSYVDYRCYASFGWYGNLGVVFRDGFQPGYKVCQGDPNYDVNNPDNANEAAVLSTRRVYRGLFYRVDNDPETGTESGKVENSENVPMYWSVGVGAGADLGLDANGNPLHNFIVTTENDTTADAGFCVKSDVMRRDGSNGGDLFAGNEDDFYCLNPHVDQTSLDIGLTTPDYPDNVIAIDPFCEFDFSDPPAIRHTISGMLNLEGGVSASVRTSLGAAYCEGGYDCFVYEPEGAGDDGWTGYLQVDPADLNTTVCNYDRFYITGVTNEAYDPEVAYDGPDFSCSSGQSSVIRGLIAGGDLLMANGISIFQIPVDVTDPLAPILGTATEGHCEIDPTSSSFSCVTSDLSGLPVGYDYWSVELRVETSGSVCDVDNGGSFETVTPGNYVRVPVDNFTAGAYDSMLVTLADKCP